MKEIPGVGGGRGRWDGGRGGENRTTVSKPYSFHKLLFFRKAIISLQLPVW